jgi:hypothetical protein
METVTSTRTTTEAGVEAPKVTVSTVETAAQASTSKPLGTPSPSSDGIELSICNVLPPIKRFVECPIEELKVTDIPGKTPCYSILAE